MRRIKVIFAVFLVALIASTLWQIAGCEIAYYTFRDELDDVAAMPSSRIGLDHPKSDDDVRDAVFHRAQAHHISLTAEQIRVDRAGSGLNTAISLEVKYEERILLPGFSFPMRFAAKSGK